MRAVVSPGVGDCGARTALGALVSRKCDALAAAHGLFFFFRKIEFISQSHGIHYAKEMRLPKSEHVIK
jgi:hypothetical protein